MVVGAGTNLTTGSNNIDIGNPGVAGESDRIRIGVQGTQVATYIAGIYLEPVVLTNHLVSVDNTGKLGLIPSSLRFKKDVEDMADQTDKMMSLRPVNFHFKNDPTQMMQYGLIAEEVAQIYPEFISRDAEGNIYSINYMALIPVMLKQIQQHGQKHEYECSKLDKCEADIQKLYRLLEALQA